MQMVQRSDTIMRTGGGTVLDAEDIAILERLTSLVVGDIVSVVGVTV